MKAFIEIPISKKFSSIITFRKSYKGPIYNKIFKNFNNTQITSVSTPQGGGFGGMMNQQTTVTSYFYDLTENLLIAPMTKILYH